MGSVDETLQGGGKLSKWQRHFLLHDVSRSVGHCLSLLSVPECRDLVRLADERLDGDALGLFHLRSQLMPEGFDARVEQPGGVGHRLASGVHRRLERFSTLDQNRQIADQLGHQSGLRGG